MYRFVEHTAELELELEGSSREEVLEEALRAFSELAGRGEGETVEREVDVEAADLPALLAAWLDELLFVAETQGILPDEATVTVRGARAAGVVRGRHGDPRPLVKGVTLHRLRFHRDGGAWRGRVVLDV